MQEAFGFSGGRERELGVDVLLRPAMAMRASGAAGLGAGTEGVVNDGLDGACASTTFCAAAETAIDLLGMARKVFRSADGVTDIVVAEDVAGTNNHENGRVLG
jgi:hypothetical protein